VSEMQENNDNKKADNLSSKYVCSTAETCDFFQITRETLSSWTRKGAPKEARGKYDIQKVMQWRYQGQHMETPATRKLKAEADLKEAKAAQEKIKLGITRTKYIPVEDVQADLTRVFANVKKSLLAISHLVASDLAGVNQEAAEVAKGIVDNRIEDALKAMAEGRVYIGRGKKKKAQN